MKTFFKNAAAAALASVIALTGVIPAQAQVIRPDVPVAASSDVTSVQFRRDRDRYEARRYWRGHRGYRDRRAGYRYHNGYWYPLAAFAAGAIIGGAIANQPRAVPRVSGNLSANHYQWCQNRYRSYDSYSNTFQPYNGPRQQCVSPYY
jgi:hypothetical protein